MTISHNTFTYLRPVRWWMRLLQPIAQCQNHTLQEQIRRGRIDCVDVRVRMHNNMWWVCHGVVRYLPLVCAISECNQLGISNMRLLIEGEYTDTDLSTLSWHCLAMPHVYEARTKKGWKQLLPKESIPDLQQHVGSMQSWYGKICPRLWHILHQDEFINHAFTHGNHSFDFI